MSVIESVLLLLDEDLFSFEVRKWFGPLKNAFRVLECFLFLNLVPSSGVEAETSLLLFLRGGKSAKFYITVKLFTDTFCFFKLLIAILCIFTFKLDISCFWSKYWVFLRLYFSLSTVKLSLVQSSSYSVCKVYASLILS